MAGSRRIHSRYQTSLAARLFVGHGGHDTTITNLSLGGARLSVDTRLALGTRIEVEFRITTQEDPLRVGASVRWASEDAAGVAFDGMRAREVWSLNKFFASLPQP